MTHKLTAVWHVRSQYLLMKITICERARDPRARRGHFNPDGSGAPRRSLRVLPTRKSVTGA